MPYLLTEKTECLRLSRELLSAITFLQKERKKGVDAYEKKLREILGAYPIGMPSGTARANEIDAIVQADALVIQAWHTVRPNAGNGTEDWQKAARLLKKSDKLIGYVYKVEATRSRWVLPVKEKSENKAEARKQSALEKLEPFRLRNLYKRYTHKKDAGN